jgi:hypothetical protein
VAKEVVVATAVHEEVEMAVGDAIIPIPENCKILMYDRKRWGHGFQLL